MKLALIGHGAIAHQILAHVARSPGLEVTPSSTSSIRTSLAVRRSPPALRIFVHQAGSCHRMRRSFGGRCSCRSGSASRVRSSDRLDRRAFGLAALRAKLFDAADAPRASCCCRPGRSRHRRAGCRPARRADPCALRSRKPPLSWGGAPALTASIWVQSTPQPRSLRAMPAMRRACFPKTPMSPRPSRLPGLASRHRGRAHRRSRSARNVHELEVQGAFGRFRIVLENVPSPDNPKTSALTAMSIIRLIENRRASIVM